MIRNFLYLDSDKLRSLSSQLFEGVTDYILHGSTEEEGSNDQQRGPFASGQTLADIFKRSKSSAELRFLEDHAYTLFEKRISESDLMISVDESTKKVERKNKSFAKVTGNLQINDTKVTLDIMDKFNQIGYDITRVVHQETLLSQSAGKNIVKKDVEKLAKSLNLQMDSEFLLSLGRMIEFSSNGLIDFQISQAGKEFSSPIKRVYLRESEDLIIQKYSRYSELDFTIFGIITQSSERKNPPQPTDVIDGENLKAALRNMSSHVRALEDSFSGIGSNEIIIDPIAVYQTL